MLNSIPRLLIIDDLVGRRVSGGRNLERATLCGQLLLKDITGDHPGPATPIAHPVAEAMFVRGQRPVAGRVRDLIENDIDAALDSVRSGWGDGAGPRWSMVLVDLSFRTGLVTEESHAMAAGTAVGRVGDDLPSGYFGLQLLERIVAEFPDLPVVILSGQDRAEVSRLVAERRARGFLDRSAATPESLREFIQTQGLIPDQDGQIVGGSTKLLLALREARVAARSRRDDGWNNILLRGERGTGKELFARFIHRQTELASRPFEIVDSGALSPTLFASELFGHVRGAFTDARTERPGRIVLADRGELFLDEIGNMPPEVQVGLLRVLQEHVVVPVGASRGRSVSVRFLSATNLDIENESTGFRADLLDRLREGGTVVLPPLRERVEDIPVLAEKFVREAEQQTPGARPRAIDPETIDLLREYDWPGNIRQLRAVLAAAVNSHHDVEHLLPLHIKLPSSTRPAPEPQKSPARETPTAVLAPASLDALAAALDAVTFDGMHPGLLSGKLPVLHGAYARLVARYVEAVLYATRRVTHDNPEGAAMYHAAMKLAYGDPSLPGSKAADLIKRLLNLSPGDISRELEQPLLRQALDRARHLRPARRKRDGGEGSGS